MPTVAFNLMDQWRLNRLQKDDQVDFEYSGTPAGAVLKIMIIQGSAVIDQNTDVTLADITHTEVSGSNYTAGGNAVANATITMDGSGLVKFDGDDPAAWAETPTTGWNLGRQALLVYDDGGAQSTWEIVGYSADFGADEDSRTQDFQIQFDAAGIMTQAR